MTPTGEPKVAPTVDPTAKPIQRSNEDKCQMHLLLLPGLPVSKGSPNRDEGTLAGVAVDP
jgi:hypothetical protein